MAFQYYQKIEAEEQYLYAKEIALKYGFYTLTNNPNSLVVNRIIKDYYAINNTVPTEYYTACLTKIVHPHSTYHDAMRWFIEKVRKRGDGQYTFEDGRTYNFRFIDTLNLLA